MIGRALRGSLFVALLGGFLCPSAVGGLPREPRGVVVETVGRGSYADRVGLRPGDVLLTWTAGPGRSGALDSPFDLVNVFIEEVPRRRVCLQGKRNAEARSWCFPAGSPSNDFEEVRFRPELSAPLLSGYRRGESKLAAGRTDEAVALWRAAARSARARGNSTPALWLEIQAARALAKAGRGDEADRLYRRSIRPLETAARADPIAAQLLREWGASFMERYLWEQARDCYQRALAVDKKVSPLSLAAAWSLTGLGQTTSRSGDPTDPGRFLGAALESREKLAPGSSDHAATYWDWGQVAFERDNDLETADRYLRAALKLQRKATPGSLYLARRLVAKGQSSYLLGKGRGAERLWQRALAIGQREGEPENLVVAHALQGLSSISVERGHLLEAEGYLRHAAGIVAKRTPNEVAHEDILHELGLLERRLGRDQAGAESLCRAVDLVEQMRRSFQSIQEVRMRWSFSFAAEYADCAEALVALGKADRALEVAERGRARAFLDQLAERSFRVSQLPARSVARWRRFDREYDEAQRELARLRAQPPFEPSAIVELERRLHTIRRQKARMKREYLARTALRYPEPSAMSEIERSLAPGTTLLFFSVGEARSLLFIARRRGDGKPSLTALPVAAGREDLRNRVVTWRRAIAGDRFNVRELKAQGEELYRLLLGSAEHFLAGSRRLLIVPDGPLHLVPFAALVRGGRYLIERQPIHFAGSITAYREITTRRRPPRPHRLDLLAFGDPLYPPFDPGALRTTELTLLDKGLLEQLPPLPASRQELLSLKRLFPNSRTLLGRAATEEEVTHLARDALRLHFAVHGLADDERPLDSALALSPPRPWRAERDNGLLQTWEIMERLHLDADLVTLSACDTALGREVGGEGLLSLARAFQYAGARSVVATLWEISDRSTEPLLRRFYSELLKGKTKEEALREAQVLQIREGRGTSPFSWAAFQLFGDWQ